MVATIGGAGLGLFNTSAATLGLLGAGGNASTGRRGEQAYVNSATGNLVIQGSDDRLASVGLDLSLVRTYNSQGTLDGDNNDNWRIGVYQSVALSGFWNAAGSTVTKTFGDGAQVVYRYDTARALYVSTDGDGAHDTLSYNSSTLQWTWTDGSSRATELYSDVTGRILSSRDADGNTTSYTYNGAGRLTGVADASGQTTTLVYSGNNLSSIQVTSNGVTQTLTRYSYDGSNRLQTVTVDLSPADGSITDGRTYATTYTYDGTSTRVASIGQTDGSLASFTYVTQNGQSRVRTHSVTSATGVTRTTTYTYSGTYTAATNSYAQTDVSDPLTQVTTYNHDANGRLTAVLSPTVGGVRLRTSYGYDTSGNLASVTEDPAGLNRVTTYAYDANGNLLATRAPDGSTTVRTYSTANQLLTETAYTGRDPDAYGSGAAPTGGVTSRYAYDAEQHLRFAVSALGSVTEYQYNATGQKTLEFVYTGASYGVGSTAPTEAQLVAWAGAQDKTRLQRTDTAYDFRGQVSTVTRWATTLGTAAGNGVPSTTRYTYDQRGLLLNTTEARGEATTGDATDYLTSYTYDGLGRALTTTQWLAAGQTRTTSVAYDDANRRTVSTYANGLVATATYNQAGDLLTLLNTGAGSVNLGTTTYTYDANGKLRVVIDPSGVRTYLLYDEAGRKVADVDGDGSLTEYVYDGASEPVKTIRYAVLVPAATLNTLANATTGAPSATSQTTLLGTLRTAAGGSTAAANHIARAVYNSAGLQVYAIDEVGAVTEMRYDGTGLLTDTLQYFTPVTIASATNQVLPGSFTVTTNAADRRTRFYYDADGHQTGMLDAENYLTENLYNAAGQLVQTIAYAGVASAAQIASATLLSPRPAFDNTGANPPEKGSNTYYFYDGQGRVIGQLDGEGYLTETVYDIAGRVFQSTRFDVKLTYVAGTSNFTSLRASAANALVKHTATSVYDGAGRLSQFTNFENAVTTYTYDGADHLISSTAAFGSAEARTTQARYDGLGRVTQALSGVGSTQAVSEATWTNYGTLYTYDVAGRLLSKSQTAVDGSNTQVLKEVYYYDADGRRRFTINARGDVSEMRYDAFGQSTDMLGYSNRLASTTGLNGGLLAGSLSNQPTVGRTPGELTPVAAAVSDTRLTSTYTLAGQVLTTLSTSGATSTHHYNAFGEEDYRLDKIDATRTRRTEYTIDHRGLVTLTRTDSTGLNVTEGRSYDAFGRLKTVTDEAGNVRRTEYDRLGRAVVSSDAPVAGAVASTVTAYDAFDRVLTVTDALNNQTKYAYNDTTRSVTLTTPEGIQVSTTTHNLHGQTSSVAVTATGATNTTTYVYDADGRLKSTSDSIGALESRTYDSAGRLVTDTDGTGAITRLGYDAASRVLTRTVDTGGAALLTSYQFDGMGRTTLVTDPNNIATRTDYDNDGRVTLVSVDPTGLNLRTRYTYDLDGSTLTQEENYGTAAVKRTQYIYDTLGRRTEEITDPTALGGTLNLRTQYKYDSRGNLTRTIDARNFSTWFVYDQRSRLVSTINALGEVQTSTYDPLGRVTGLRRYFTTVATGSLGDVVTATPAVATNALDEYRQTVYNKNGDAVFEVDATGAVTENQFDALGQVTRTRVYGNRVPVVTYSQASLATALTTAGNVGPTQLGPNDRIGFTAYDRRGRVAYTQDGAAGVVGFTYDLAGNLKSRIAYAPASTALAVTQAALDSWSGSTTVTNDPGNTITRYWYDGANRLRFSLDGEGNLGETRYADSAREVRNITFAAPRSLAANATLATVVGSATIGAADLVGITKLDAAGRVWIVTDGESNPTTIVYNTVTNQRTLTDAKGGVTTETYDPAGRLRTRLTPGGVLLTNVVDSLGNVTSATLSRGTEPAQTTTYLYDALGRTTRVTDGEGFSSSFEYDHFGNQTRVITGQYLLTSTDLGFDVQKAARAANLDSRYAYDTENRVTTVTDGESNGTLFVYDAAGNRLTSIDAANSTNGTAARVTTYEYNAASQLVRVTTPLGGRTEFTYWGTGDKKTERVLQSATVDASGKVVLSNGLPTNPVWSTTTYAYFKNGRVKSATDDYGTRNETYYDAAGNVTELRYAAGSAEQRSVKMQYDRANRKVADIDAYGKATTYAYDKLGNRTKVTMPANAWGQVAVTRYYYDADSQLATILDPTGFVNALKYDLAGNQTEARVYFNAFTGTISDTTPPAPTADTARDRITTQVFDRANKLVAIIEPDKTRVDYTNDATGKKLREDRSYVGVTAKRSMYYQYDRDGRLVNFKDVDNTVTAYSYDGVGNIKSETVTAPQGSTDPNLVRKTEYDYDLNNRRITETFDRTGLNIVRTTGYDLVGNVVRRSVNAVTETGTPVETYGYDLNNRQTRYTDGVGNVTQSGYDRVGNRTSRTDARLNTTNYEYDLNNRLRYERLPSVPTYSIAGGPQTLRPTTEHIYDAVGNEVQTIDANGNKTTYYYDGNNRVAAKLSGVGGLCVYAYTASGEVRTQTEYMTAFAATAQNPATRPAVPGGEVRLTSFEYDPAGRLTKTTFPPVPVTTVTGAAPPIGSSSNPTATTGAPVALTEEHVYNAFGDEVETRDRAGNRTLHYYDPMHREVATLDPLGYLVERDYDTVGNLTAQRVYLGKVANVGGQTAATRPAVPAGTVHLTNWVYDTASRLTAQVDPLTDVDTVVDGVSYVPQFIRRATTYTYDQANNLRSKTVAAGLPEAQAEYYYYDGANRRIGVIDKNRVATQFFYDANGNLTRQWTRYGQTPAGSNITGQGSFTLAVTVYSTGVISALDQVKDFSYDAANRQTLEVDRMRFTPTGAPGQITDGTPADDLSKSSDYDAAGNRTRTRTFTAVPADGSSTNYAAYDASSHVVQTIDANGVGSVLEYDVIGNLTRMYSGIGLWAGSVATGIKAARTSGVVNVSYTAAGANTLSWVVYDTVSHANIDDFGANTDHYANRSASRVPTGGEVSVDLPNAGGGRWYFRVVTTDIYGNLAWSDEQSITVPSNLINTYISDAGEGYWTTEITAAFDGAVSNVKLLSGPSETTLSHSADMTLMPVGSNLYVAPYQIGQPNENWNLFYAVQWTDASGAVHTSPTRGTRGGSDQVDLNTTTTQSALTVGGTSGYRLQASVKVPATFYGQGPDAGVSFTQMQASWKIAGSTAAPSTTAFVNITTDNSFVYSTPPTRLAGTYTFLMSMGDSAPLAAGTYRVEISGKTNDGRTIVVDSYDIVVGAGQPASQTQQTSSWIDRAETPDEGYATLYKWTYPVTDPNWTYKEVEKRFPITLASDGRRIVHVRPQTEEGDNYKTVYSFGHTAPYDPANVRITSSTPTAATTTLTITLTLSPEEAATVDNTGWNPGDPSSVWFYTRRLTADGYAEDYTPTNDAYWGDYMTQTAPGVYTLTLTGVPVGGLFQYGIQYGVDPLHSDDPSVYTAVGHLFSDNLNIGVATTTNSIQTFIETQQIAWGTIWYSPFTHNLDEGYQGHIQFGPDGSTGMPTADGALALTGTGRPSGQRLVTGQTASYVVKMQYDALNNKISSTENAGIYTEYGFDKNGNVVETRVYGLFDKDLQTFKTPAAFGAQLASTPVIKSHATYDARNRQTAQFDGAVPVYQMGATQRPATRQEYDAYDNVTAHIDALGHRIEYRFNAYGLLTGQTEPKPRGDGGTRDDVTTYRYNVLGNQTQTLSPGTIRSLRKYDGFGRLTSDADALGNQVGYGWDLFDRMVSKTDGRGMGTTTVGDYTTRYVYDNRNRLVTEYAAQGWHLLNDPGKIYETERLALGAAFGGTAAPKGSLTSPNQSLTDALVKLYETDYTYNANNDRTSVTVGPGTAFTDKITTSYDGMGHARIVVHTGNTLAGQGTPQAISSTERRYDAYGNVMLEMDASYRTKTYEYEAFGRKKREVDEDGVVVNFLYDEFGRLSGEIGDQQPTPPGGTQIIPRAINRFYNADGRLRLVQDVGTGIFTSYEYDRAGNRMREVVTSNTLWLDGSFIPVATLRNQTYSYNVDSSLRSWSDTAASTSASVTQNIEYDADGNMTRVSGTGPVTNTEGAFYRYDHKYTYDAAGRVTLEVDQLAANATLGAWGYDRANNLVREGSNEYAVVGGADGSGVNAVNRIAAARSGGAQVGSWRYDPLGHLLESVQKTGSNFTKTTNTYLGTDGTRLQSKTVVATSGSFAGSYATQSTDTAAHDVSGRVLTRVRQQGGLTLTSTYNYWKDGREKGITTTGGRNTAYSVSKYDGNKNLVDLDTDRIEDLSFKNERSHMVYDNQDHVMRRSHDAGYSFESSTGAVDQYAYLYANDQIAGETGQEMFGGKFTRIDAGAYSLVKTASAFGQGSASNYTVYPGDTLMSIAAQVYGNPSLWYVIADANGLMGAETLAAGTVLTLPPSVQVGRITADNHAVYNQNAIVGSTLPNVLAPPPPKPSVWIQTIAGLVAAIVAIVITVVTVGIGTAAGVVAGSAAALGIAALGGAIGGAVAAGILIAGSAIQAAVDGTKWSMKPWDVVRKVAGGALAGALSGVASWASAGFSAGGALAEAGSGWVPVAKAALAAGGAVSNQWGNSAHGTIDNWDGVAGAGLTAFTAGVADAGSFQPAMNGAFQAGGNTLGQIVSNKGDLEKVNWTAVAVAGVSGYLSGAKAQAKLDAAAPKPGMGFGEQRRILADTVDTLTTAQKVLPFVTPWARLAEVGAKKGQVEVTDWITVAGETVKAATNLGLAAWTKSLTKPKVAAAQADPKSAAKTYEPGSFTRDMNGGLSGSTVDLLNALFGKEDSTGADLLPTFLDRNGMADAGDVTVIPMNADEERFGRIAYVVGGGQSTKVQISDFDEGDAITVGPRSRIANADPVVQSASPGSIDEGEGMVPMSPVLQALTNQKSLSELPGQPVAPASSPTKTTSLADTVSDAARSAGEFVSDVSGILSSAFGRPVEPEKRGTIHNAIYNFSRKNIAPYTRLLKESLEADFKMMQNSRGIPFNPMLPVLAHGLMGQSNLYEAKKTFYTNDVRRNNTLDFTGRILQQITGTPMEYSRQWVGTIVFSMMAYGSLQDIKRTGKSVMGDTTREQVMNRYLRDNIKYGITNFASYKADHFLPKSGERDLLTGQLKEVGPWASATAKWATEYVINTSMKAMVEQGVKVMNKLGPQLDPNYQPEKAFGFFGESKDDLIRAVATGNEGLIAGYFLTEALLQANRAYGPIPPGGEWIIRSVGWGTSRVLSKLGDDWLVDHPIIKGSEEMYRNLGRALTTPELLYNQQEHPPRP